MADLARAWQAAEVADNGALAFICARPQQGQGNQTTGVRIVGVSGATDGFTAEISRPIRNCRIFAEINDVAQAYNLLVPNVFGGPLATCRNDVRRLCSDLRF